MILLETCILQLLGIFSDRKYPRVRSSSLACPTLLDANICNLPCVVLVKPTVPMSAHSERYGSSFPRFPLKYWDLIFSENRPPGDPDSWLEALRLIREDAYTNDPIKLFMEQYEVHHPKVEKLGLFTAGTSPSNLSEDSQCEGRAWLDDRCEVTSHGGGTEPSAPGTLIPRVYRQYDGHLSASKLKDHLSEKVPLLHTFYTSLIVSFTHQLL